MLYVKAIAWSLNSDKISVPIPWQIRWTEVVEGALQHRVGHRLRSVQRPRTKDVDRREHRLSFILGPGVTQITPHMRCWCRCSGNGGTAGTIRNTKMPLISSGALVMKSRTSASSLQP